MTETITREYFDSAPTWERLTCPDCGTKDEHPEPGCTCRDETSEWKGEKFPRGYHKYKYHHTCVTPPSHAT